jgi:hypothetical protein
MSALSDYAEKKLADHLFGAVTFTPPATLYYALFTSAPSDSGGGTQVSGGSYARSAVANNTTSFPGCHATTGVTLNGVSIQFPTATGNWGTVTHWGIFDAETGGNLLAWGALTTPRAIVSGDTPRFNASAFSVTFA